MEKKTMGRSAIIRAWLRLDDDASVYQQRTRPEIDGQKTFASGAYLFEWLEDYWYRADI
jgi:hypothetical protein